MLLVGGLVLLVAVAGAAVLGVLLLGLWRRATALLAELRRLGEQLEEAQAVTERLVRPDGPAARPGGRHPDVETLLRPRHGADPGRTWGWSAGSRQTGAFGPPPS